MLKGMMMDRPLMIADLMRFAVDSWPEAEIVSSTVEGGAHSQSYGKTARRVAQLAHALKAMGVKPGDRIATMAWNGYRHFELYYAISCIGAVCHTINPRLFHHQLAYIMRHADDKALFFDTSFTPILEAMGDEVPPMKLVAMTDRAHMPDTALKLDCYEALIEGQPETYDWPEMNENAASTLCYTSGTTGDPKGALYSHRSTVLHAFLISLAMNEALREGNKILPVVPLFHVNAWGLPYAAPLTGASLVMPGPKLDGASLWELMDHEEVFSAWGVPTVWQGLLAEIAKRGRKPQNFGHVVVGGSAAPRSMVEAFEKMGVDVCHAWGMTEMSPVGTHGALPPRMKDWPLERRLDAKSTQGRRVFGVDLKIVDEDGDALPHDGKAQGALYVRGNTIISGYYENADATKSAIDKDGWFGTGDVATIDPEGFLRITDRTKDLIKSGGEWISSIDLENAAIAHPGIANCAVIAVKHPKWDERPLLVAMAEKECAPSKQELLDHLAKSVAKWQLPDDVVFVDDLPLTATGKLSKLSLRQQFADYKLPDA